VKGRGPRENRKPEDWTGYPCEVCEYEENCKVECEKFITWLCSPITNSKGSI
jgi:hypothetical protein